MSDPSCSCVGSSEAATSETRAESIAGVSTRETSTRLLILTTKPSSVLSYSVNLIPTLKPSFKPSMASTIASLPRWVLAILKVASIPVSVVSKSNTLPIGLSML